LVNLRLLACAYEQLKVGSLSLPVGFLRYELNDDSENTKIWIASVVSGVGLIVLIVITVLIIVCRNKKKKRFPVSVRNVYRGM